MRMIFIILLGLSSLSFADFTKSRGVVTDSGTQLEWQDDYSDNGGDIKSARWQEAIDYCEALSLDAKSDWRLPNVRELLSLVNDKTNSPAINTVFERTSLNQYWSATSTSSDHSSTWVINFDYGRMRNHYKIKKYYVRCVRAGE